jgi:hypothetical protein
MREKNKLLKKEVEYEAHLLLLNESLVLQNKNLVRQIRESVFTFQSTSLDSIPRLCVQDVMSGTM